MTRFKIMSADGLWALATVKANSIEEARAMLVGTPYEGRTVVAA